MPCSVYYDKIGEEHNASKEEASDPQVLDLSIKVENWRFECSRCKRKFSSSRLLREHFVSEHKLPEPHRCDECKAFFAHIWSDDEVKKYQCPSCTKSFIGKQGLKIHVDAIHLQKRHICNICGKSFAYKSAMLTHVNGVHKNDYRNRHFQNVHEENKQHACTLCSRQFFRKVDFIRHMHHLFIHFGLVVKITRVCPDCFKLANTDHFRVDSESRHRLP
ncbi:unnamed protein product [Rodentolepis nana]|uniref:C2H2-type domain-containing protein n=1 Tax=Rodentolepis nana TaxID=102285 RepID=A0A3P7V3J8_RODNA|nr:unnamed protein product [Rodentolepis nana]